MELVFNTQPLTRGYGACFSIPVCDANRYNTVKPVTRGHLSGCLNCIFSEPKCTLTLKCTCEEGTPDM